MLTWFVSHEAQDLSDFYFKFFLTFIQAIRNSSNEVFWAKIVINSSKRPVPVFCIYNVVVIAILAEFERNPFEIFFCANEVNVVDFYIDLPQNGIQASTTRYMYLMILMIFGNTLRKSASDDCFPVQQTYGLNRSGSAGKLLPFGWHLWDNRGLNVIPF